MERPPPPPLLIVRPLFMELDLEEDIFDVDGLLVDPLLLLILFDVDGLLVDPLLLLILLLTPVDPLLLP